jgi:hypothetical protein
LGPGAHTLSVHGEGFTIGATLSFQNGKGRAPRVQALKLFDEGTLEARVEVPRKGPRNSRY